MEKEELDPNLRLMQNADMKGRVVLLRVDHNVVKNSQIKDPYRIDVTFGTLFSIVEKGGRPVLITHIGRPRDKKTGNINCHEGLSVEPIKNYLEKKLAIRIHVHNFPIDREKGILHIDSSINSPVEDLKKGKIGMIYLPNSRWFQGEQSDGPERDIFSGELASLADLYINDAFSSWRAHASTYDIAKKLPSFAGILLQNEIKNIHKVLTPKRPFLAVIAGSKYDTKIGPLNALYKKVDHLILGGVMNNTFLAAKYGLNIEGISEEDKILANELVQLDKRENKILEIPYLIESDTLEGKYSGRFRTVNLASMKKGSSLKHLLDIDAESLNQQSVKKVVDSAETIFVNAVMGLMPAFSEGTMNLYNLIASNRHALKLFAGGDTLQELRNLCPGIYLAGIDDPNTYYFTGGGSILVAIEQGSAYSLKPVEVLLD
ncbi:MAG: phosphoglycerate kinase [Deltaproteobacteria bacterium]|nr:phosphoglycerate kinase [Deltaproteobacteria bacterium]